MSLDPDIYAEISERLSKVTGPDPILDVLIKIAFRPHPKGPRYDDVESIELHDDCIRFTMKATDKDGNHYYGEMGLNLIEPVTGSVDAIAALIRESMPGCEWWVSYDGPTAGYSGAVISESDKDTVIRASVHTASLALARAFLAVAPKQAVSETV